MTHRTFQPAVRAYWLTVRAPRYSLSFAFPLLAAYEVLAFALSRYQVAEVRNGADVLLKSLFISLGGWYGLVVFGGLLVGAGAALVWHDVRRSGGIQPRYFMLMAAEAVVYALAFGSVTSALTQLLVPGLALIGPEPHLAVGATQALSFPVQLMVSLGAGIYEELLFRVFLVSALALTGTRVLHWSRSQANAFAVVVGALVFATFHYIGPYGETLALGSFAFRTVAGLLFSGLYVLRGFGITAWTHALYDVFLAI